MNNTIPISIPVLDEILSVMKTQNSELAEIKALLKIDRHDEREFLTANKFCMRNGISRKTMDKRVGEGLVEVDESLGVKRYRKVIKE